MCSLVSPGHPFYVIRESALRLALHLNSTLTCVLPPWLQVHLHKSFVELHFSSRPLPQNVSVVACVDGKALDTVLPGQVRHSRREALVSSARTLDASACTAAAVRELCLGC